MPSYVEFAVLRFTLSLVGGIVLVTIVSYNPAIAHFANTAVLYLNDGEITSEGLKIGEAVLGPHGLFFSGVVGLSMSVWFGFTALALLGSGPSARSTVAFLVAAVLTVVCFVMGAGAADVANEIYTLQSSAGR